MFFIALAELQAITPHKWDIEIYMINIAPITTSNIISCKYKLNDLEKNHSRIYTNENSYIEIHLNR